MPFKLQATIAAAIIVLHVDDFVLLAVLKQFLNHIQRHQLFNSSQRVLLAVSGGIDSMVMWRLFTEAGFDLAIAHCNFQLRGAASDEDESFVRTTADKLKQTVYTKRFDTEQYANEKGISIQMAARDLRYEWFEQLIKENGYTSIATAHHLDDSVETVLLNFAKGSGAEGFTGIPVRNGNVIRPMLFATRAEIASYAMERNIVWREDESNVTDDYQRNLIRHQILPVLLDINPSLMQTCQQGMQRMQGDLELLWQAFENWKAGFVTEVSDRVVIKKEALSDLKNPVPVLWRFIKNYGFNYRQATGIVEAVKGQPGKQFYSGSHQLLVDRDSLLISIHAEEIPSITIDENDCEINAGPWHLRFFKGTELHVNGSVDATLDASKIIFPLTLRKWRPGDSFQPMGMKHTKKLSDFLIDNKVSRIDKEKTLVLESDGTIVYVVGWRIDERYRITDKTTDILYVHVDRQA